MYFPTFRLNLFPFLLDVNSITFPLSNPSVHVIFIFAPSITSPVLISVFVNSKLPFVGWFFNSAFTTSPFSFISNSPTSVDNSYPSGACVSSNVYFPTFNSNLFPSLLDINSITFPLSRPSVHVILI